MFTGFLIAVLFGTALALLALLVSGPSPTSTGVARLTPERDLRLTLVSLILILTTLGLAQMVLA